MNDYEQSRAEVLAKLQELQEYALSYDMAEAVRRLVREIEAEQNDDDD